jgi:pimeloyl-ACP methyl ester carboxylesterase
LWRQIGRNETERAAPAADGKDEMDDRTGGKGRRLGISIAAAALAAVIALPTISAGLGTSSADAVSATAAPTAADVATVIGATSSIAATTDESSADAGLAAAGTSTVVATTQADRTQIPAIAGTYTTSAPTFIEDLKFTSPVDCGDLGTCQLPLDVYVPTGPGPYPTVVLLRGGPGGIYARRYLDSFATELASSGILVYLIDVRDVASEAGGYPQAMQDTACGIRYARATAAQYGGDAGIVTLVGHSFGAYIGSVVALNASEYTSSACLYGGSGRPDAFVGLAGCYDVAGGYNAPEFQLFFGGTADETAATRTAATPFAYATGAQIPVRLVAGTADTTVDPQNSIELNAFLVRNGWNVGFDYVNGADHSSILDTTTGGAATLDAIEVAVDYANATDAVQGKLGS